MGQLRRAPECNRKGGGARAKAPSEENYQGLAFSASRGQSLPSLSVRVAAGCGAQIRKPPQQFSSPGSLEPVTDSERNFSPGLVFTIETRVWGGSLDSGSPRRRGLDTISMVKSGRLDVVTRGGAAGPSFTPGSVDGAGSSLIPMCALAPQLCPCGRILKRREASLPS